MSWYNIARFSIDLKVYVDLELCFTFSYPSFYLDIDECSNGSHDCHQNAACINTPGQFNCSCQSGFSGNGRQCQGIILTYFQLI